MTDVWIVHRSEQYGDETFACAAFSTEALAQAWVAEQVTSDHRGGVYYAVWGSFTVDEPEEQSLPLSHAQAQAQADRVLGPGRLILPPDRDDA